MNEHRSKGGKTTAKILRKQALDRYYGNPIKCNFCQKIIHVNDNEKVSAVRKRKYCNKSCAAKFNNKTPKRKKKIHKCLECDTTICSEAKRCQQCKHIPRENNYLDRTKEEIMFGRLYYQWRTLIGKHARNTFAKNANPDVKKCYVCQYKHCFHVAHIKPVSEFENTATLREINHINNLVALCPNHHFEYDSGILKL